jgi:hypothetical protein
LVGCTARSTLLSVPPAPTSFYMAQGDRAHQPSGLGAPDQGAFVRARPDSDPLGSGSARDQTNSWWLLVVIWCEPACCYYDKRFGMFHSLEQQVEHTMLNFLKYLAYWLVLRQTFWHVWFTWATSWAYHVQFPEISCLLLYLGPPFGTQD